MSNFARRFVLMWLWIVAAVAAAASGGQPEGEPALAITNVNVVDAGAGAVLERRTVIVSGGRIRSIERDSAVPGGAETIDGTGRFLIPGLWDMHVHLRDARAPDLLMPQFIAHGVTGVRDMASDCDGPASSDAICIAQMRDWQRKIDAGEMLGPRLLALSSFVVNPPWDAPVTEDRIRALVRRIKERGADLIKIYFRLSPDAFGWLMDEASKQGLAVGGHIPLRMTATEVSDGGLRSLEHARDFLFDCFPGSAEFRRTARSQNPPMDVMRAMVDQHDADRCDEVFRSFVRNRTWYVPTHVTRRMDAFADDQAFRNDARSKYVPKDRWTAWNADADRMVALDPSPEGRRIMRAFYENGLAITGRAHRAGVNIVLGTDAGDSFVFPGSSVHDELEELVKAGLTPAHALAAATVRAAEFLRREPDYGSIAVGKRADLVLLGANPLVDIANTRRIDTVVFNTRVLRRAELDAMLERVDREIASGK
ncbi:MAG: amidohydrolase family protein [Acidobacteriota bacterium]